MSFVYKLMGAQWHSNWQLSQYNQYVSYALLSWAGSTVRDHPFEGQIPALYELWGKKAPAAAMVLCNLALILGMLF